MAPHSLIKFHICEWRQLSPTAISSWHFIKPLLAGAWPLFTKTHTHMDRWTGSQMNTHLLSFILFVTCGHLVFDSLIYHKFAQKRKTKNKNKTPHLKPEIEQECTPDTNPACLFDGEIICLAMYCGKRLGVEIINRKCQNRILLVRRLIGYAFTCRVSYQCHILTQ